MRTKQEIKEYSKQYYQRNKEKIIENVKKRQKLLNYSYEKTDKARKIRNIKRRTRYHFPLLNQKCKFCNKKATEHHHTTRPIEYDKFIFICHKCHMLVDELNLEVKNGR